MKIRTELAMQFLILLLLTALLSAATVDGLRLHSSVSGKGPRTVILVHGWTCDDRTWQSQVPELARDYWVITLDLPGHGKSESPRDGKLSMDLFARAIEAVRSEAKADRVVLVGHSMGTAAIVQYARLYPQHTVALVIVDGSLTSPEKARSVLLSSAKKYAESMKVREAMIERMFSPTTTEETKKLVLSMVSAAPAATAVGAMEAFVDPTIWKDDVFTQPVLGIFPEGPLPDDTTYMKTRFPNLEYVQIPSTGHFLMLEKPEEFNRLLRSFLDRQEY